MNQDEAIWIAMEKMYTWEKVSVQSELLCCLGDRGGRDMHDCKIGSILYYTSRRTYSRKS